MSQLSSIVIVGRPNVGKSTLFNAITKSRRSIVGNEPGITRDRIYAEGSYRGKKFELIDTGGIIPDDEAMIPSQILKQARVALESAAHIIFLIDGRTEITGVDRDLAAMLRKLGKPVTLAVNKIDSPKREDLTHEFHSLGFPDVYAVSAEHQLGIGDLLGHVTKDLPELAEDGEEEEKPLGPVNVAIIGRPNVGKSTLLNALIGRERSIVSPVAGTTRDAVDETLIRGGVEYHFVDTAGIRRKGKTKEMAEKMSVVMARRHLRMSHVAILVIDATEGVKSLDATIAGYAHEEGRGVILCVNKWDTLPEGGKKKFRDQIAERLKFLEYAPIAFVSALTGKSVNGLFMTLRKVWEAYTRRIPTAELNRFMVDLRWEHANKIKFLTQASTRPPTFIAFTRQAQKLHFSAERYLVNRLREAFDFEGVPIVVRSRRK